MDFKATPTTIDNLLSGRKQYTVPRNQREFSWEVEQLGEFWQDIVANISFDNGSFHHEEYFIGTIVLAGDEDGFELQIVDGQQRLTVLTMFLRAIIETLANVNKTESANALYKNYVEGMDLRGQKYFKINRFGITDLFKTEIQHFPVCGQSYTDNVEDSLLKEAYKFLLEQLDVENIASTFYGKSGEELTVEEHIIAIEAISIQIATKIKVIKVVVNNEDDAYIIFEILNARGMDLDSADLIKNKLFSVLKETHPIDFAKSKWDMMKNEMSNRDDSIDMATFLRHWWNSKFPIVSEGSLYKQFKTKLNDSTINADLVIKELESTSKIYSILLAPSKDDWNMRNSKRLFFSLNAYNVFNISSNRPLVLALFDTFHRKKIKLTQLLDILEKIENFHFIFTSVCKERPTGVESSYSLCARKLRASETKPQAREAITELEKKLRDRIPSETRFVERFQKIKFTNRATKHK